MLFARNKLFMINRLPPDVIGQHIFELGFGESVPWIVTAGVGLISSVTIGGCYRSGFAHGGGGGLTWANGLPVVEGETLTLRRESSGLFRVGIFRDDTVLLYAESGGSAGGTGGTQDHAPGLSDFGGGTGGNRGVDVLNGQQGMGGAAGYMGNGGQGGGHNGTTAVAPTAGTGGGGGAGARGSNSTVRGGGGVGLYGIGDSGAVPGRGGSGGDNAIVGAGGKYGGGSVTPIENINMPGAVRIMYGGGRSYPYNAGDL